VRIVFRPSATTAQVERVESVLRGLQVRYRRSQGPEGYVLGLASGGARLVEPAELLRLPGVAAALPYTVPYRQASREYSPQTTVVRVGDVGVGGNAVVVIAGPCAVEDEARLLAVARRVKAAGAHVLRGGAFKPRTSPYSFQGLGREALAMLQAAGRAVGLPVVTEVLDTRDVEIVAEHVDLIQVGSRNAQNYELLREVGGMPRPVLLKRGMMTTIEEYLLCAEYVLSRGNEQVILCERGIRTFETATRNTLDIAAVPVLHRLSHLPVLVDPSHGTGAWEYVVPMARAAIAAGADGIMIEVHGNPPEALSDGPQALTPDRFDEMMADLVPLAAAVGRRLQRRATRASRPRAQP
jgi:3-deoxy-7-phosphoheptulonate synthase